MVYARFLLEMEDEEKIWLNLNNFIFYNHFKHIKLAHIFHKIAIFKIKNANQHARNRLCRTLRKSKENRRGKRPKSKQVQPQPLLTSK